MAEKINFTQDRIRNLPIPEVGRLDYYDIKVPKLTCRVSYTGSKSFVLLNKSVPIRLPKPLEVRCNQIKQM